MQVTSRWCVQNQKREEQKKKQKEFEKKSKGSHSDSPEWVQAAYQSEKKKNKRDYLVLAAVMAILVIGIVIFVVVFTRTSNQTIYNLIEKGNYSTAYQAVSQQHNSGKNVDALVYTFVESCIADHEYKRAVSALDFLSQDAETNPEFFEQTVDKLLTRGKPNRAMEVLDYMMAHGETLSKLAEEIYEKHHGEF